MATNVTAVPEGIFIAVEEREGNGPMHRRLLSPGGIVAGEWQDTDLSDEPAKVQEVAAQVWHAGAVAEFRAKAEAEYAAEAALPIAMPTISDRQFFQALAMQGLISQAEALAAVKTGDVPAAMQAVIDALPEEQRFATTMLLSGATTFEFGNPLVGLFAASQGMDDSATRDFWRFAAGL